MNTEAVKLWKEKLAYLQREEAIASDPEQKFQLEKQIQECQQKIKELQGYEVGVISGNHGSKFFCFSNPKTLAETKLEVNSKKSF
ncbi:MAG: hypothetical protein WBM32_12315 [Crocosphaera sp.]